MLSKFNEYQLLGLKIVGFLIVFFIFSQSIPTHGTSIQAPPKIVTERELDQYYSRLDRFNKFCGRYPLTREGLKALKNLPHKLKCNGYPDLSQYDFDSKDGWSQPIKYRSDGKTYRIDASHGYHLTENSPLHGNNHWDNPTPLPEDPAPGESNLLNPPHWPSPEPQPERMSH
jgi:hypothetical protein